MIFNRILYIPPFTVFYLFIYYYILSYIYYMEHMEQYIENLVFIGFWGVFTPKIMSEQLEHSGTVKHKFPRFT